MLIFFNCGQCWSNDIPVNFNFIISNIHEWKNLWVFFIATGTFEWIFALHKLMQNAESSFILLEIATTIGTLELFYLHKFPRELWFFANVWKKIKEFIKIFECRSWQYLCKYCGKNHVHSPHQLEAHERIHTG